MLEAIRHLLSFLGAVLGASLGYLAMFAVVFGAARLLGLV